MQWRRAARILAMQALCQFDVLGEEFERDLARFIDEEPLLPEELAAAVDAEHWPPARQEAQRLTRQAWMARGDLDAALAGVMPNWKPERLALVDRAILRLAASEMLATPAVPAAVAINEAIELARAYGSNGSAAFVNGVLDALRRNREP